MMCVMYGIRMLLPVLRLTLCEGVFFCETLCEGYFWSTRAPERKHDVLTLYKMHDSSHKSQGCLLQLQCLPMG